MNKKERHLIQIKLYTSTEMKKKKYLESLQMNILNSYCKKR